MNKILEYLEQLELSEIEAKIYLQLLKTGAISVSDLAITMGINRTTTYVYVDQLIDKELVVKIVKGSRTQVAAMQPDKMLPYLVEQKIAHTKKIQEELPAVLKDFHKNFPKVEESNDAEIKYYKGRLGVKKIYEEALMAKELRSYANLSEIDILNPENFVVFNDAFQANPNLKIYEIVEDSPNSRKQTKFLSQNPRYFYKFIPSKVKLSSADTLIYEGKVSIINIQGNITGVVFHNKEYYKSSKELFDFMWEMLPEENNSL